MNVSNLTKYAVGLVVGLVMVAGLIIPIVEDSTSPYKTVYNNTFGSYAILAGNESATITIDADNKYYYNGELYEIPNKEYVLLCSHAVLSYSSSTHELLFVDDTNTYHATTALPMQITISNGTMDISYGSDATTYHIVYGDWCGIAAPEGDYRVLAVSSADKQFYANSLDQIYGAGQYKTGESIISYHGKEIRDARGVIDNLVIEYDPEIVIDSPRPIIKLSASTSNDLTDIKYVGDFEATHIDGFSGSILVPNKVIGETAQGYQYSTLLSIIPLVSIICLIVFAAGAIYSRRA